MLISIVSPERPNTATCNSKATGDHEILFLTTRIREECYGRQRIGIRYKEGHSVMGKAQLDKFKEAARELECDDDEKRFKEKLKRPAKAQPQSGKPK